MDQTKYILLVFCILNISAFSQSEIKNSNQYTLGIRAARSFATSGDVYGGFGNIFLEKTTSKKGTITLTIGGNMHASGTKLIYPDPWNPSEMIDASWRYLSAGVQAGLLAGHKMSISRNHAFHFSTGPLLRYQNNSNDGYSLYFPLATQFPIPLYSIENHYDRQSFSFGGLGQIEYRWQISPGFMLGIHSSAQFDTEGDFFYNYGLTAGSTFFKQKK